MTKWMRLLALIAVLSLVAAACGEDGRGGGDTGGGEGTTTSGDPDEPTITSVGEGEGEVNIIAWAGYIEDGSTDPAYDWVTSFEEETGCQVNVTTAGTSDEMVALMQEGGGQYDLVTASGDASLRLIAGGTVQPVNLDLIESYSTVDPNLQDAEWFTVDTDGDGTTEHYGAPYQWGSNVLMYSTAAFKGKAPDSWSVVFEEQTLPDGESNKGRVQAYDGAIYVADAALYLRATQPDLGIEDPYALTQKQFDAALDLLRQQRELIGRYWHDAYVQMDDFVNGEAVASGSWPFQVNFIEGAGKDFSSVIPKEGATGLGRHHDDAHRGAAPELRLPMDGVLARPQGAGRPGLVVRLRARRAGRCEGNELLDPDGCVTNGIENFDQIEFWKTPQSDCFAPDSGAVCVPYQQWVTNYVAVIGGR